MIILATRGYGAGVCSIFVQKKGMTGEQSDREPACALRTSKEISNWFHSFRLNPNMAEKAGKVKLQIASSYSKPDCFLPEN